MHVSPHSYLTAAVAALTAGAVALAPVEPLQSGSDLSPALRSSVAVDLATAIDPFTPLVDTIQAASDNIAGLVNTWVEMPLPILQQVVANQVTYIGELPAIGTIIGQVVANVGNAVRAPFAVDLNTLDPAHVLAYQALPTLAPDIPQGLSDFLTTSVSGLLIGLIGPVLSPVLALGSSITSAIGALQTSDWAAAVNALINIPAAMVNAFLNGGPTIDLTSLLAPSVLPNRLDSATVTLGGLLSQGASIFNAVGLQVSVKVGPAFVPGPPIPAGPPAGVFGSLIAMTNAIAGAIAVTPPAPTATRARSAASEAEAAPDATSAGAVEAAAPRAAHRASRGAVAGSAAATEQGSAKRAAAARSAAPRAAASRSAAAS